MFFSTIKSTKEFFWVKKARSGAKYLSLQQLQLYLDKIVCHCNYGPNRRVYIEIQIKTTMKAGVL